MGNKNANKSMLYDDVLSLTLQKISKSANPTVINLHIDNGQYPESGLIAIGNEFIENYSETKNNSYSFYHSSSKILKSCFFHTTISDINGKKEKSEPTLIIALENRILEFLHGKTLISFKNYTPTLKLSDLIFPNENIEFISSNPEPFKELFVDYLLTIDETQFLVGYQNGIVQRISLPNTIVLKTYNPLLFQREEKLKEKIEKEENQEEEKKNEEKQLIIDNFLLPGIESLGYCHLHELVFVNHRITDKNFSGRNFSLEETPIFIYKSNGEKYDRLRNCIGTILQSNILENRGLYLVLTSENIINVWNYQSNNLILKIALNNIGLKGGSEIYYTSLDAHCFEINQRLITADKLYDYSFIKEKNIEHQKIDGDLIYTAERNGGLFISKITFENEKNEISWTPLKILDMKENENQNKSKVLKSIKNIPNNVTVLNYDKFQDTLFMVDHKANIRLFKKINRKLFTPKINS